MYSFAQRDDTVVVDEPLYGHYLRATGALHPGREEVLGAMELDGNTVMRRLRARTHDRAVQLLFVKQMAHHLVEIDRALLQQMSHVLLIRDPREMLPSLTIQLPEATLADTGLQAQWELFCELDARGEAPAVLDARELLLHPEPVLTQLCARLQLPFTTNMLRWSAGPRPEDGVWARHWYHAVHQSTGFAPYQPKPPIRDALLPLLHETEPFYRKLVAHAIRA